MADYVFVTRWRFEAPIETVWESICRAEEWPRWWRGVERVDVLEPGGSEGVGGLRRFAWNHDVTMRWGGEDLAFRLGCAWRDAGGGGD